jgi:predicted ribonuclease YlaK
VKVDKSMTIKALAREPDMQQTLSWLDANVPDDRIIASILSLQAERPGARIVLVTGDVNLQNKSNAALVETAEAP